MRSIPVIVDSHLRVDGNLIGADLAEQIFEELTIWNYEKEAAKGMNRYGWWSLPDEYQLGDLDGDTVVMPRGYAFQLKTLLRQKRLRVQWIDRRQWQRGQEFHADGHVLKPHQEIAVQRIIKHQQGMYEAPTGSGKTVTCIGFIRHKRPKWTLILVDQLGLLHQWRKQLGIWLGCNIDDIGIIGDGKRQLGERITVATVQTLWKLLEADELEEDFFEVWDAVILDECFPRGTMVSTPLGDCPIESLAIGDIVYGVDHSTGQVVETMVRRTFSRFSDKLVEVAGVKMTPNHPVLTQRGYVRADEVEIFDTIMFHATEASVPHDLRAVWAGFPRVESGRKVLLQALCNEEARKQTRQSVQGGWRCHPLEVIGDTERAWVPSSLGWQWNKLDSSPEELTRRSGEGLGSRVRGSDWQSVTGCEPSPWYPYSLQDRLGLPGAPHGGGDRWRGSSFLEAAGTRQAQDALAQFAWLEGDSRQQQGRAALPVDGRGPHHVYNVETDTGNYFAGGLLVHNCHHVTAATIRDLVSRFNAKYRLGTSATTDRQNGKFEFALNVLGEVFYQEDEEALRDAGMLMRPTVKVIRTNFNYIYWNDHNSDDEDKCEVPGCPMSGKRPHAHRNNYTQLKQTLVADEDRNRIVINTMLREALKGRHHHLIVSDEVKHLQALEAVLIEETTAALRAIPPVYTLIGKVTGKKRAEMKTEIENAPEAIVFATVAKEGLDIPAIDRIYLPFPSGNGKKVQQWIGRGTRIAEDKTEIVVFDFFDINVGVLKAQFRKRRTGCYYPLGMEIDLG